MNINLDLYRTFYYVGKLESITSAAKALCVSQPAVSQAIKQLESSIGVKLFKRNAKGMSMTIEGKQLFRYVSKGYETILEGEEQLKRMIGLEDGEIRIGASDMTLQFYLLPYLEQFHDLYPHIKVRVTNAPTPETLKLLEEQEIDFGIVTTPFSKKEWMEVHEVKQIENCFIAGNKFRYLQNEKLEYQRMQDLPLICLEKRTSTRKSMELFLEKKKIYLEPEFELATSEMIVQFVAKNLGIGMVVKNFALEEMEKGSIFELQFQEKMPEREICVVTNSKIPLSRAANKIREML